MYIEMTKYNGRELTKEELQLRREAYMLGYENAARFARDRVYEAVHLHYSHDEALKVLKTFNNLMKPY